MTFRFNAERLNTHGWNVSKGISDVYKDERGVKRENAGDEENDKTHMLHIGSLFDFWEKSYTDSIRNENRHVWDPILNLGNDRDDERQKRRNFSRFQYQPVFHYDVNEQGDGITY